VTVATQQATEPTRGGWLPRSLAVLWAFEAGLCPAAPTEMRDVTTHEQLALQLRKSQQEDPMKLLPAAQGNEPAGKPAQDLLSQSDILCFDGKATLVPKRAILLIPKSLAARTQFVAGSSLLGWADFYAQNRGWITTVEVTREQAEGHEPLAADVTKRFAEAANLVVATYQGGPISVLPPKAPPPAPASLTENTKP